MSERGRALRVLLAFAAIYLIWGSTFLAIRLTLRGLPPVLLCALRLLLAAALLLAWTWRRGAPRPTRREAANAALAGLLLPGAGNTAVTLAETHVPSGLVALLVATIPLWVAVLGALGRRGVPPPPRALLGLALGFGGIALLLAPAAGAGGARVPVGWALLPVAGALSWAWGSLWSSRARLPRSPLVSTGIGLAAGGVALLALAAPLGEYARFAPARVPAGAWLALLYLVGFGSVIGYTAYLYLLREVAPTRVATYAFVNPVVAMALGWAFAGEALPARTLVAAAAVLVAVALITTARPALRRAAPAGAAAAALRRP